MRRCHSRCKDARVWTATGAATKSCYLRSSSHVLPHDQEEREGGFGYKRSLSPTDAAPRPFSSKGHIPFHLLPLHNAPFSLEFSARVEFSREDRVSRLVLTG